MDDELFNSSPRSQSHSSPTGMPEEHASFSDPSMSDPALKPPPPPPAPADDDWGNEFSAASVPAVEEAPAAVAAAAIPEVPPSPISNNSGAMEALQKQIAARTANFDAATKQKEAELTAAAKAYMEKEKSKREKHVSEAKARHRKEEQEGAQKIDAYKKSGAVWNAVGMLVDLQKPNPYSKNTERMRTVLTALNNEKVASK